MDFFRIRTKEIRGGALEVYPDFIVGRSKDLMVRGKSFYAIWDEKKGLWSTDEYDAQCLIDEELKAYADEHGINNVKYTGSFESNSWNQFKKFMSQLSDNSHQLDDNLTFVNTVVKKTDYVSRRLPYPLVSGDHKAWDELVGTLYSEEERAKIEWSIGAVVSGHSKKIQKFLVLYGSGGTGKGTILEILEKLFVGYTASFDAKGLGSNGNAFATEAFMDNPLVAIQQDGDLSKIEDNTQLNSIISHEKMRMNAKYKPTYTALVSAFLFMGTNKPVKISDAKSGLIRRLIDVNPTGILLSPKRYHALMAQIDFELGAIAQHCLDVYREMGKNYYNTYRPLEMMYQTDIFFNFIEAHWDIFKEQDGTSLRQAYSLYKEYCSDTGIDKPLPQYKVRGELANYFKDWKERATIDGVVIRSYFSGFKAYPFKAPVEDDPKTFSLVMDDVRSIFDLEYADQPAQGYKEDEDGDKSPKNKWWRVKTTLADIDTSELHYVKIPENHIIIDFDLTDDDGEKSLERNLEAASEWKPTYAELSQGGSGVHLHYTYDGDVTELAQAYSPGIEVKTLLGDASLRRKLTKCNNVPVATINSGLPVKEKKMLSVNTIQSEMGLRELIARNLRKEIHPGTKPSVDFIQKILEDAYLSGMSYDVTDLRTKIMVFANNSTNQPLQTLKVVQKMKFKSDESIPLDKELEEAEDDRLVFFDIEVYRNLLVICWKYEGDSNIVSMINPSAQDVEKLFRLKLVGFNNRRYDNHILYARHMGYDTEQLYKRSKKILDKIAGALFGEAYNLSYADIYDLSSKKQSLKKFQIELGLHHMEMDIPWDQPVPEDRIADVVEYCCNDVASSEQVFIARKQDFIARKILADLSGLTVNDTTQKHTAKIIFGNDRNPQRSFVYTKLNELFPGYSYDFGKSTYRGELVGEGGYVYSEPGIYEDVVLLDVESMHPTSIGLLNLFGEYTPNFMALVDAQLAIKHGDFDTAKKSMGGKLVPYIEDIEKIENPDEAKMVAKTLRNALKIAINIVYGLTSAKFDNPFRDLRNIDNIVAKRGALFMIELKHFVQEAGFSVIHIKTDSVKIPGATPWLIEAIVEFGKEYGYDFEQEATYDKFCLVNDAVYIAKTSAPTLEGVEDHWTAVGAQFQQPYVYKTLFSGEEIEFDDLCETKQVTQGAMYLDFTTLDGSAHHPETMHFIGKTGRFVPVLPGFGGGTLYRVKDDKTYAVTGTKGYLWAEAAIAKTLGKEAVDMDYFYNMAEEAKKTIEKFGDFEGFVG